MPGTGNLPLAVQDRTALGEPLGAACPRVLQITLAVTEPFGILSSCNGSLYQVQEGIEGAQACEVHAVLQACV